MALFTEPSYGIGEAYLRSLDPVENLNLWNEILNKIAKWRFNTIRLAFTFPGIVPNSNGSTSPTLDMDRLNDVLSLLDARGYKAVIDMHNYIVESNHDCVGWFGSPTWIADWLALVSLLKDNPVVGAYEIFNEPFKGSSVDLSSWYNFNWTTDDAWRAYSSLTAQIREIDPVKPVVWGPGGLGVPPQDVADFAINPENHVVKADHPWSDWHIATTEEADANVAYRIASMKAVKDAGGQIWNGECGVHYTSGGPDQPPIDRYAIEKYYAVKLINECLVNGFGFNLWLYTKNHWYVGSADDVIGSSNYMKTPSILPVVLALISGLGLGYWLLRA